MMITCDLCGKAKDCLPKQIEGKEYDICGECWEQFAEKLRGRGRKKDTSVTVFLLSTEREDEGPESLPGEPPTIFGSGVHA